MERLQNNSGGIKLSVEEVKDNVIILFEFTSPLWGGVVL